jgi:mono/diheme cytochrome c family protein
MLASEIAAFMSRYCLEPYHNTFRTFCADAEESKVFRAKLGNEDVRMKRCQRWPILLVLLAFAPLLASGRSLRADEALPPPPEDATAAKTYAVLDQYCARCHQSGKVAGATPAAGPAAGIGNILDLESLARDPSLIRPGNPDGSKLYTTILMRTAVHDQESNSAGQPKANDMTAADLDALRTWINGLPPAKVCRSSETNSDELDAQNALQTLTGVTPEATKQQRFISLTILGYDCASSIDMGIYREAVGRAVNSLSWALDPVALQPINESATVFRVDLSTIGWTAARWDRMAAAYPFKSPSESMTKLSTATSSSLPLIRGDWFVTSALKAPLYYDLLGLPDRLQSLLASLKINLVSDVANGKVKRYGTKSSAVARGARLAQRHDFANGAAWLTYEYAPTAGRQDVFDVPSGPTEAGSPNRGGPKPDATLMQFALPSGFTAFYMANADGQRINDIANSILRNDNHPAERIGASVSCFACHSNGARGADDQLRARLQAETLLPKDQHDKLLAVHGTPEAQLSQIQDDQETVAKAMREAQLTPGLTRHGQDPISMLVRRYNRDVDQVEVADILSLDTSGLNALEANAKGAVLDALQRLNYGQLPRDELNALLPSLYALRSATNPADAVAQQAALPSVKSLSKPDKIDIVLKASKSTYRTGDLLSLSARASSNCHMTIVNVDAAGRGTVIFPNDFEQNNAVEAGIELKFPSAAAPYQFRLKDKGRETIIAVCTASQKSADGIVHDFEKQRFTELGEYRSFISRVFSADPDERKAAPRAAETKPRRAKRGRTEPQASKDEKSAEARELRDIQGRTAIQIEIK